MNNDIITLTDDNNQKHDYKILSIINKDFKYIIYTDLYNNNYQNNLFAIKVKDLNNNEKTIPITDMEWKMIEQEYQKIIN